MDSLLYALPALACPVGMGVMMWLMMRGGRRPTQAPPTAPDWQPDPRETELARLREEIQHLRAGQPTVGAGSIEQPR
ncbi:hypothetical protein FDG2_5939 [Candidatus Protofrankia californiensis]|uniref:Uncharacterized protein n=1 Tax=Candidatus Protofrankia californiensis TaxID=1839754 RepID=A0A1C3PFZ6_9ACTN|nr:hypothetical protein FDG2_5939 [Candidatus Protofrankia californiensis]